MDYGKHKLLKLLLVIVCISISLPKLSPVAAVDDYTITNADEDVYVWVLGGGLTYGDTYLKWNISSIPTGRIVSSATLFINITSIVGGDNDLDIAHFANQAWDESTSAATLYGYPKLDRAVYTGVTSLGYNAFDIKSQFTANYGNTNFSLQIRDPDYGVPISPTNTANVNNNRFGAWGTSNNYYIMASSEGSGYPYLEITLTSPPAGTFQVAYNFPTLTDQTTFVTPQENWNGTQLLYNMPLYPYEAKTNVSISSIPTSYSFVYIHPNSTDNIEDTISVDGTIDFNFLNGTIYEVVFDPNQDWHTLHISLYAPDGVGLMWESFQIYINNTRVPYPPEYRLETGYYEYAVKDYFSQTVLEGSFTIYDSNLEDVYQNWEVPLYLISFHNGDLINYYLNITRNSITRTFPLPPKGEVTARLYGLSSNVDYSITIYKVETKEYVSDYTLSMPALPVAQYINHDNDEQIWFPTYEADFEAVKYDLQNQITQLHIAMNQLILLGVFGLIIALIIQRYAIFKSLFSKPLLSERRSKR